MPVPETDAADNLRYRSHRLCGEPRSTFNVLSSRQSRGPLKRKSMDRELNQINVLPLVDVMLERFVTVVDRIGTLVFSQVSLEIIRV